MEVAIVLTAFFALAWFTPPVLRHVVGGGFALWAFFCDRLEAKAKRDPYA